MNKLMIATTLALGLATGFAVAQPPAEQRTERFEQMLDKRVQYLAQELNLTDAQTLNVRAIFAEQAQARRDLYRRHRDESKALHEQGQLRLIDVLSAEQKAKFETLKAERRDAWKDKREHRRGHHRGHRRDLDRQD